MRGSQMVVHCGGEVVGLSDLDRYDVPEATGSYHPIAHRELAEYIRDTAVQFIGQPLVRESYAVTKDGNRMFGLQTFGDDSHKCMACKASGRVWALNPETMEDVPSTCPTCNGTGWEPNEYGFSIAHRNSYDKSMSVGIAAGFRVFVCDNLCISGEIKILRKHTKNVWGDIDAHLLQALVRKRPALEAGFEEDVNFFKSREMNVHEGYRTLGLLMGNDVLKPTQANIAYNEWNHVVDHKAIMANAWQFYNSCTFALKSTPPHKVLERHRALHECVKLELQ